MDYIRVAIITAAILLLLSLIPWAISKYFFGKPTGTSEPIRIHELDEMMLRGENFKQLTEELDALLLKVGDISQQLVLASQLWQERYTVFQTRMEKLSQDTRELSSQRDQLQTLISALQEVRPPVADYLVKTLIEESEKEEKRSARRDYVLFFAGAMVSLLLTILLRALGV